MKQKVKSVWRYFWVPLILLSTPGTSSFGETNWFLCLFYGNEECGASPCTQDSPDIWTCRPVLVKRAEELSRRPNSFSTYCAKGCRGETTCLSPLCLLRVHYTIYSMTAMSDPFLYPVQKNNCQAFLSLYFLWHLEPRSRCRHCRASLLLRVSLVRPAHSPCQTRARKTAQDYSVSVECDVCHTLYFRFHTRTRSAAPCGDESLTEMLFLSKTGESGI